MTRRYDGYVAGSEVLAVGQVILFGPARVVVKEVFANREDWEAERNNEVKSGIPERRIRGAGYGEVTHGERAEFEPDDSTAPPEHLTYFYGVDHV